MGCGSRDEDAAVADSVNKWCPDDTPGFPLWMRDTMHLMKTKPLLRKTLKAIPQLYSNTRYGGIILLYNDLLKSIQKRLEAQPADISRAILIVVVLLETFEVRSLPLECHYPGLVRSWDFNENLLEISFELLKRRTAVFHQDGVAYKLFVDMRYHWAMHCLVFDKKSFLNDHDWKSEPWQDPKKKDPLQQLLDVAFDIASGQSDCEPDDEDGAQDPKDLNDYFEHYLDEVDWWKPQFANDFPFGVEYKAPCTFSNSPVLQWLEPGPNSKGCEGSDLLSESGACSEYLPLPHALPEDLWHEAPVKSQDDKLEAYEHASWIARSVVYFFQNRPNPMVVKSAYPLSMAFEHFEEGSIEREFIRDAVWLIRDTHHVSLYDFRIQTHGVRGRPEPIIVLPPSS